MPPRRIKSENDFAADRWTAPRGKSFLYRPGDCERGVSAPGAGYSFSFFSTTYR